MARKPQDKKGLASGPSDNTSLLTASITPVKQSNGILQLDRRSQSSFLLNPSTWSESKNANWVAHTVPGQSDPIMQWISSGARTVTFDALVTKDTFYFGKPSYKIDEKLKDKALTIVGGIASQFLGTNIPPLSEILSFPEVSDGEDLSIQSYLDFYRSLLYPIYSNQKLEKSPPLVVLEVGKTFLRPNESKPSSVNLNSTLWVVTSISIKINKQLPNLTPMEATVSFQLTQYATRSFGSDEFSLGPSDPELPSPQNPIGDFNPSGNFG